MVDACCTCLYHNSTTDDTPIPVTPQDTHAQGTPQGRPVERVALLLLTRYQRSGLIYQAGHRALRHITGMKHLMLAALCAALPITAQAANPFDDIKPDDAIEAIAYSRMPVCAEPVSRLSLAQVERCKQNAKDASWLYTLARQRYDREHPKAP
jgi:hypothetical protein